MPLARITVIAIAAFGLAAPAAAATTPAPLPAAAAKALWCGSAFNWLARDADDVADPAAAEVFDAWSRVLTGIAVEALQAAGADARAVEARIAESDRAVLAEMNARTMRYDVESCPELAPGEE